MGGQWRIDQRLLLPLDESQKCPCLRIAYMEVQSNLVYPVIEVTGTSVNRALFQYVFKITAAVRVLRVHSPLGESRIMATRKLYAITLENLERGEKVNPDH